MYGSWFLEGTCAVSERPITRMSDSEQRVSSSGYRLGGLHGHITHFSAALSCKTPVRRRLPPTAHTSPDSLGLAICRSPIRPSTAQPPPTRWVVAASICWDSRVRRLRLSHPAPPALILLSSHTLSPRRPITPLRKTRWTSTQPLPAQSRALRIVSPELPGLGELARNSSVRGQRSLRSPCSYGTCRLPVVDLS